MDGLLGLSVCRVLSVKLSVLEFKFLAAELPSSVSAESERRILSSRNVLASVPFPFQGSRLAENCGM